MKNILLIEDNLEVRENTAEMLELASYNMFVAENGKEGVRQAKEHLPDLIICDIMMPELDGYGVLHILSKNPDTAGIPFIFLTAKAEKSDIRKGMNLGADDYITKPFVEAELLDAIEIRLARNEKFKKEFSNDPAGFNEFIDEARGLKELEDLARDRNTRKYKAKETVYHDGEYPNCLYLIVSGKVKTTKMDDYGKDLVTDLYNEGDFLGFMPLLETGEYLETASALEDTELAIIPTDDFKALIEKNRDVAHRFIKMLANNVREKEERLLKAAYASVRERVADALVRVDDQFRKNDEDSFNIQLTREELAGIAGTATETLIRTLSEFKEDGLIETQGREIRILDKPGLQRIFS